MTVSVPPASGSMQPPLAPRRRRWPWVLLVVSLALNALLAGIVLRNTWIIRSQGILSGGSVGDAFPAFVATLPPDRQNQLGPHLFPERETLRALRIELRRARSEAARVFVAEPYDKQAFIAAQARALDAEVRLRKAVTGTLPEAGERLSQAERRALIHWRGWGGYRRGGGGPRGDWERGENRGGQGDMRPPR
jgi:uncharacterized membrane protein